MSTLAVTSFPTPVGRLTVEITPEGAVASAAFTDTTTGSVEADPDLAAAVFAYLDGELTALARVPVVLPDRGEFVAAVWQTLRQLPAGRPVTYSALATAAGRPTAIRAAAAACARNPVGLFVPCHRVVRSDGGLGGYRWGLPVKRWLLDHEARHSRQ